MAVGEVVLVVVIVGVVVVVLVKSLIIVRPHERGVVERMGKYRKTLGSGMSFILPWLEYVQKVDMRETLIDVPSQEVITQDNVAVGVDAVIYFQVIDPFKVIYNVANFEIAALKLAQTNLRNVMGELKLDETLVSRERINITLRRILDDATDRWGVRITRVEIQRIEPPKDIVEAMSRQMKAERTKRAVILEAEGTKKAGILRAEGDRKSKVLIAEGEASAIRTLAEAEKDRSIKVAEGESKAIQEVFNAIHKGKPNKEILTLKYLESLEKIADGRSTKIFLPLETTGILGGIAALGDIYKDSREKQPNEGKSGKDNGKTEDDKG